MSTDSSGIDLMRARIARARREPPRPRARAQDPHPPQGPEREPLTPAPQAEEAPTSRESEPATPARRPRRQPPSGLTLVPSTPWANLAIRVRRPLDDRLADLIHALRRRDVKTSKVELIEMLLWELEPDDPDEVWRRLARFRKAAPRSASADVGA